MTFVVPHRRSVLDMKFILHLISPRVPIPQFNIFHLFQVSMVCLYNAEKPFKLFFMLHFFFWYSWKTYFPNRQQTPKILICFLPLQGVKNSRKHLQLRKAHICRSIKKNIFHCVRADLFCILTIYIEQDYTSALNKW